MISLAFAGFTTSCGKLLTDYYCPDNSASILLAEAISLEACSSECEKTGDGAVGCCARQCLGLTCIDNKCIWYADVVTNVSQVTNVNDECDTNVNGCRSAVSCTSK